MCFMKGDGSAAGFRFRGGARDLLSQAQEHEQGAEGGTQGGVHGVIQGGTTRAATPLNQSFREQGAPPRGPLRAQRCVCRHSHAHCCSAGAQCILWSSVLS